MTSSHIKTIARLYRQKLWDLGYSPNKMNTQSPVTTKLDHFRHVLWMCDQIVGDQLNDHNKEMRWLCYIQGVLASFGVYSVNVMRWQNAPHKCEKEITARIEELSSELKELRILSIL